MGIFMHVSDEGIFIHRKIEFPTSPHPPTPTSRMH